jgi:osmotically-inducible protein OsmY
MNSELEMCQVTASDIQKRIQEALEHQGRDAAKRLQVVVEGSRITLRGKVHSWAQHQAAQGAAWAAPGVSSVKNELTLEP